MLKGWILGLMVVLAVGCAAPSDGDDDSDDTGDSADDGGDDGGDGSDDMDDMDDDDDSDDDDDDVDGCPSDPLKTEPGICGCGQADDSTDADSDGTPDCVDSCVSTTVSLLQNGTFANTGTWSQYSEGAYALIVPDGGAPSSPNVAWLGGYTSLYADVDGDGWAEDEIWQSVPYIPAGTSVRMTGYIATVTEEDRNDPTVYDGLLMFHWSTATGDDSVFCTADYHDWSSTYTAFVCDSVSPGSDTLVIHSGNDATYRTSFMLDNLEMTYEDCQ